jgi:hypothetical protein
MYLMVLPECFLLDYNRQVFDKTNGSLSFEMFLDVCKLKLI